MVGCLIILLGLVTAHQDTHSECSDKLPLKNPPAPSAYSNIDVLRLGLGSIIPDLVLKDRIQKGGHRYPTFYEVTRLIIERNARVLVETGTSRDGDSNCFGDGCSTLIFGNLAKLVGSKLYSVDISEENCRRSRESVKIYGDAVEVIESDSLDYLRNFDKGPIDFLYLDSFDFNFEDPNPSQQHHLKEIEIAYSKIHQNTIIMVDDCSLVHGGKCKLVQEFLVEAGWKIHLSGYQIIFIR